MFHSKPFKKDITPFAKGGKVVKHTGKGAREQSSRFGESLTGGNPYARAMNQYPKPPNLEPSGGGLGGPPTSSPVPMGQQPGNAPTAMMPGDIGAAPEEE